MAFLLTLAAAPPVGVDLDTFLVLLLAGFAVLAGGGLAWALKERKRRVQAQQRVQALQGQQRQVHMEQHNAAIADQHRRLNDLSIAKLTAEVELLQTQLKTNATTADRHEAGKEFHELMVEKAKLEIDSLRLHITEMRKRIEDWRIDSE